MRIGAFNDKIKKCIEAEDYEVEWKYRFLQTDNSGQLKRVAYKETTDGYIPLKTFIKVFDSPAWQGL